MQDNDVPQEWHIGDRIQDLYEVTAVLGEGGMGKVYKVHHCVWGVDLAVKSPKLALFAREGGKEDFIREAETWITLGLHPHIVNCYYVRTLGGIPRIFAEYAEGGSLSQWIRSRKLYEGGHQQALERILDVAIQFAWGLHYAHEQGLVHQDIKPANVMMTGEGLVKVTDFGLAKARSLAGEGSIQGEGQSILVSSGGLTPAYCSPEQATHQPLSRKTDMWSWGVSVLEMFVGKVIWMAGVAAREALASHQPQDAVIPLMPPEMVTLLGRCFQFQPQDRPATMWEVASALQAIYERLIGQAYYRPMPQPAKMLADSLNNRALSLYDLGKVKKAKWAWEQALQADPQHLEATYNQGLVLWRQGELPDDALVYRLDALRALQPLWQVSSLLAQVYLEQGWMERARPLLQEAASQAPTEREIQRLLTLIHSENATRQPALRILQASSIVTSVSLSADGCWLAAGCFKGALLVWETSTGQCLHTFQDHTNEVESVSLSADSRWLASGSWEMVMEGNNTVRLSSKAVRLWETSTGQCLRTFEGHTSETHSVCLSADGRWLASGSEDKTVRLWETSTGHCLRIFQGHTDSVLGVSLSADGRWLASGSKDKTVRLWETSTGQCLHIFEGHTASVFGVSLSADGRWLASGSEDKTVRVWELDWELEAHDSSDWDEGARPIVEMFLACHTPYAGALSLDREPTEQELRQTLTRRGKPIWNEEDFQDLIHQLQYAGYGWLRPEGVRRKLEEITAVWQESRLGTDGQPDQEHRPASWWSRLFHTK